MIKIVAELSGNHRGSLERALDLVEAAHKAGATHIKTQCFDPESLTLDYDGPGFIVRDGGVWDGRRLIDLYRETAMPMDWHAKIFEHARALGMEAFASVFSKDAVDHIAALGPCALKIASLEIVDLPLIAYAAMHGFPMILSCGMASDEEINDARIAALCTGAYRVDQPTLLHCPPGYPAGAMNLAQVTALIKLFSLPVGLSDHSLSTTIPAVAIGMGATIIEKHLTLSRLEGGVDAGFSMEPDEFSVMVAACREAEAAIRSVERPAEPHRGLRRSLYVIKDIAKGEAFTEDNVRSIRPGNGLAPRHIGGVLGQRASMDLTTGTPLALHHVASEELTYAS